MQPIMSAMWDAYEAHLKDLASEAAKDPENLQGPNVEAVLGFATPFQEFCVDWLNRTMGHDQIVMSADRRQFVLTDRTGDGNLPDAGAIQVMGNDNHGNKRSYGDRRLHGGTGVSVTS
jgi:hypothetical protein